MNNPYLIIDRSGNAVDINSTEPPTCHDHYRTCHGCPDRVAEPRCHTTCEGYKARQAVLDELEQVKRERDALLKIIDESMCDDEKCIICTHYQPNNADADCALMHYLDDGNTLDGECKFEWRGVCAENGGKDDAHD